MASALRWVDVKNYHLTLRFLGDTTASQCDAIGELLGNVAAECPPFSLQVERLGAFPHWPKMRVLWAGLTGDLSVLHPLQAEIERGVQSCGFVAERQGFHPHATLAYASKEANSRLVREAGELLSAQTELAQQLGQWTVLELVLMRSDLRPTGAVYTVQGRYPLGD